MQTLYVNLFAGPGAGKSTTAADVFARLKRAGVCCELVTEYAKDVVWDRTPSLLEDQVWVTANQWRRLHRVQGQVEVVVTDSPILLAQAYSSCGTIRALTAHMHARLQPSYDIEVVRVKPYDPVGRGQTEAEARDLDAVLRSVLLDNGVSAAPWYGNEAGAEGLASSVLLRCGR